MNDKELINDLLEALKEIQTISRQGITPEDMRISLKAIMVAVDSTIAHAEAQE